MARLSGYKLYKMSDSITALFFVGKFLKREVKKGESFKYSLCSCDISFYFVMLAFVRLVFIVWASKSCIIDGIKYRKMNYEVTLLMPFGSSKSSLSNIH